MVDRLMSPLTDNLFARWLLLIILLAGGYFFNGFLVPVLAALIIGFASWPAYEKVVRKCNGRTAVAATIMLLLIIAGLIIPISIAISYALKEAHLWLEWLLLVNRKGWPTPGWIAALPGIGASLGEYWKSYLGAPGALNDIVQGITGENIGSISRWLLAFGRSAVHIALTLLFMLITLFFLYKDGTTLAKQLDFVGERILARHWQRFSRVIPATVSATVFGMAIIALGEGVVLGIAYAIAGVSSAVALGVITGFMALIPGGAPLAFTSVSLYLIGSGSQLAGIGLFLWGAIELFIVDKTLRPRLVGGPIKLPFLPTFFGLVGGVTTMGFVGLFVGPVLMALLVAIWREWVHSLEQDDTPSTRPLLARPDGVSYPHVSDGQASVHKQG
jgi:predicted PurR-regulated permease PerM